MKSGDRQSLASMRMPERLRECDLTLVEARLFDEPSSPYAESVESAKTILRSIDKDDKGSIRAMAQRISSKLQPSLSLSSGNPPATIAAIPATSQLEVAAGRSDSETMSELQAIEDLLTGTEAERRQGLDRLHQLLRHLRTASR
jgi:hypothetical protein